MSRGIRIALGTMTALGVLGFVDVLLCLAVGAQWRVVVAPGPTSLPEALTLVVLTAATVLGAWLAVSTGAAVLAHLPGKLGDATDRCAAAWAPAVSRRLAAAVVGAVVGASLTPVAAIADGSTAPHAARATLAPAFTATSSAHSTTPSPAPGWTPSRPLQRPQPASSLVTGSVDSHPAAEVVVHRGDTLWDIVRRQLGADASDAEVADAWPAWHHANRTVIGDDPDLILPGQILRPPNPAAASASEQSGAGR